MPKKIGGLTLYDVPELEEILGVHRYTLRKYIRSGKINGRKIANKYYVTEESLRAFFNNSDNSDNLDD